MTKWMRASNSKSLKFGGHRHCGGGDMFLVDALASMCQNSVSLQDMACKHTSYHINNSDPGHMCLLQQLDKHLKIYSSYRVFIPPFQIILPPSPFLGSPHF